MLNDQKCIQRHWLPQINKVMDGILNGKVPVGKKNHPRRSHNLPEKVSIAFLTYEHIRESWLLFLRQLWDVVIPGGSHNRQIRNIFSDDDEIKIPPRKAYFEARDSFARSVAKLIFCGVPYIQCPKTLLLLSKIANAFGNNVQCLPTFR